METKALTKFCLSSFHDVAGLPQMADLCHRDLALEDGNISHQIQPCCGQPKKSAKNGAELRHFVWYQVVLVLAVLIDGDGLELGAEGS